MSTEPRLLAIDQGTTSSRAIVFDAGGRALASAQREFTQHYPRPGWVEHDPEEIWETTLAVTREALARGGPVVAIGITNQRETTLLWDRKTGRPVHNAIVWQDRRTAASCQHLRDAGHEPLITERTGLLLDPYFSATKLAWMLEHVEGARARAEAGELAFGTVDAFLLWRLTGGRVHATDATNAARTLLLDIATGRWDPDLLALFGIPEAVLPEVRDCASEFGTCDPALLGHPIPVRGMAGDQQAATVGQACFEPGSMKSTYGTGCFALINTGEQAMRSTNRLLSTIAYRLDGRTTYALEGSIFVAGAAVQWLRDGLGIIRSATETEALAGGLDSNRGVYLVPAFTGLGAPWWDPDARGALFGLSRDTGPAELARAALESVCFQTRDLVDAMVRDGATPPPTLRVDGGMVVNDWLAQCLADVLDTPVERPVVNETTALGAAGLAGLQSGVYDSLDTLGARWQREARFEPRLPAGDRERMLAGWAQAVAQTRGFKP
ncbi:MAG: glycerol kinase GlpK [Ectothiorhodospiraceae bacterium]|nr:glycerol kinase GlpK [Ectothiorhodospiraceae bacterium]